LRGGEEQIHHEIPLHDQITLVPMVEIEQPNLRNHPMEQVFPTDCRLYHGMEFEK